MRAAVIEYMSVVQPVLRESTWVYNLSHGWTNRTCVPEMQLKMR